MQNTFLDILQENAFSHPKIEETKLRELYFEHFPNKDEALFFWDLQNWKEDKLLQVLENTYYKIRRIFSPSPSSLALEIHQNLIKHYDLGQYCFIESTWYNQFSRHQSPQNLHIIELEKEICESVFYHLKEEGYQDIFLLLEKEDNVMLERYAFEAQNPIIIQKIVSKAPTQKSLSQQGNIKIPYLEKMLVDLFADENLFTAYQNAEQNTIIENMLLDYVIDFTKLFAYAQRRRKEKDLKQYLFENFAEEINQITL
jgi:hypothetical protein